MNIYKKKIINMYAFVDLDYCLITKSTNIILFWELSKKGFFSFLSVLRLLILFILFTFKLISEKYLMQKIFRVFKGCNYQMLLNYSEEIFQQKTIKHINHKLVLQLKKLKNRNYKIIIVTGSTNITSYPVLEYLRFDGVICSELEVKNKIVTGLYISDINIGETKKDNIMKYINYNKESLKESYSFSDSINDIELLKMTSNSFVVNPDKKLYKLAKTNKWGVL